MAKSKHTKPHRNTLVATPASGKGPTGNRIVNAMQEVQAELAKKRKQQAQRAARQPPPSTAHGVVQVTPPQAAAATGFRLPPGVDPNSAYARDLQQRAALLTDRSAAAKKGWEKRRRGA